MYILIITLVFYASWRAVDDSVITIFAGRLGSKSPPPPPPKAHIWRGGGDRYWVGRGSWNVCAEFPGISLKKPRRHSMLNNFGAMYLTQSVERDECGGRH